MALMALAHEAEEERRLGQKRFEVKDEAGNSDSVGALP